MNLKCDNFFFQDLKHLEISAYKFKKNRIKDIREEKTIMEHVFM